MTGRTVSHYRIGEEISRGGMGIVYRATDVRLNREVALKVLPEELVHDQQRKARFIQEAQAASALEHPHIAVIHEVDDVDGVSFIAMELIRGEKLSDVIGRQRMSTARALELATEIASGLALAHERAIVHRDLKPANVMVTEQGHAKIIDFGIAKLLEPVSADTTADTVQHHDTADGVVVGTTAYMSPEQARGEKVGASSDIFSFGVLLHEMLTGRAPFQGRSTLETSSAILHQPAPRLASLGPTVTPESTAELQRVLDKCLEKDTADRYQGMKDVIVDLRAARRRLESPTHSAATITPAASQRPLPIWAIGIGAAVVVAVIAAAFATRRSEPEIVPPPSATSNTRPSVAVLYFDNSTGTPDLDWLRTGITDMVVTDLSQSQTLEVISTDRLYAAMAALRRADNRVTSPEVIREIAERTGASNVIVGSYMKAGDAIRINVRLQEAKTGRIISSERVDGANESALFAMIDDLSARIRKQFESLRPPMGILPNSPASSPARAVDRGLNDVTTSSIEAYRQYAEGYDFLSRGRYAAAVPLLEKAVAIDPAFAMAYAKLSVVHSNLGHFAERDKYGALSLKHADRLTLRERYYIEGFYYGNRRETVGQAIEAYKKCLEVDPAHQSCRHNLALRYSTLERFHESIEEYEELLRRGSTPASTTGNLANDYRAVGAFDKAEAEVKALLARTPEGAMAHIYMGDHLVSVDRLDEAQTAYAKAAALDPAVIFPLHGLTLVYLLREDFPAATAAAAELTRSPEPSGKWIGALRGAVIELQQGKSRQALALFDRATKEYGGHGVRVGLAQEIAADTLLSLGRPAEARPLALRAVEETTGDIEERWALSVLARVEAALGKRKESDAAMARLTGLVDPGESAPYTRVVAFTRGTRALIDGDVASAVSELTTAQSALPKRGPYVQIQNPQPAVWFALGRALMAAGKVPDAIRWFEQLAASKYESTASPLEHVRSFYYLGTLYEKINQPIKAREAYRRFAGYWRDSDIDRDKVAEALRKSTP